MYSASMLILDAVEPLIVDTIETASTALKGRHFKKVDLISECPD